ncbi:precorrin-6A/cobalt-precorrin-6A reductase [Thermanaerovibrio velox]|uniref:precorrin-6A/cobalt-precorrin-6A reductase n=1 Tax=Thermanaerovibrio velox TaxID=108007 RepID=UPI00031D963E|nr:precorrin-6A/cobalt-precorrin-6A reductase [Thermanaerovibrio velox]
MALVCGGDPVLFGLAALASHHAAWGLREGGDEDGGKGSPSFRIFPGVSAAQGAACSLGPYYTNGLCMISLSDYLQDWGSVARAMERASESGLSVALYNPVSRDREGKLGEVRRVFQGRTALVCRDVSRPGERVAEIPAEELSSDQVDMRSLIVFPGGCCSKGKDGVWRDMRGYASEINVRPGSGGASTGCGLPPRCAAAGENGSRLEGVDILDGIGRVDVLILGGTGEGREAAERLISLGLKVAVSVAFDTGLHVVPPGAFALVGRRSADDWAEVMGRLLPLGLRAAVDCAHPFAEEARRHFRTAAEELKIPLIRISRPVDVPEGAVPVMSYGEMAQGLLELTAPGDTVFLSFGVRGLPRVVPVLKGGGRYVLARLLPTVESLEAAKAAGLTPKEILCSWGPMGYDWEVGILKGCGAKAVGAKGSGDASGVTDKLRACGELGIPLLLLCPPNDPGLSLEEGVRETLKILGY